MPVKVDSSRLDTEFAKHFSGNVVEFSKGIASDGGKFELSDQDPEPAKAILDGRTERFKTIGGSTLTATLFNEGKPDLMVIHPGWMGDGEHALSKLQVSLLAEHAPDSSFAYVNMPGARGSEALPGSVMKEMKRTGSFEAYGEELASVLDILRQDYEIANGVGWSTGARAILGVLAARHKESGLDTVVALDPSGSVSLGRIGIAQAFLGIERGYAKSFYPDSQTIAAKSLGAPKSAGGVNAILQGVYGFPVAMSRKGLEDDLTRATKGLDGSKVISLVSPEFSALNMPRDVTELLRRVSLNTDARLLQYVIEGQSHTGIMDQNAPLFAQLIADINRKG